MPSFTRAALLASAGFLGAMLLAGPVLAGPPACTCQNLESLQQEYQNAVYLEGYMRALAVRLKAEEDRLNALKVSSSTDPDQNLDVFMATVNLRDTYRRENMHLPFDKPVGYTGPDDVEMKVGTCEQRQDDLDAMEDGSACEAIADMALAHEFGHRDICNQMGAKAYWARPLSVMTLEEADRYKIQAANLKSELRRVLEAATVEYKGETLMSMKVPEMMESSYRFVTSTADIGQASGGDTWTMTGKGTTSTSIETLKIAGMTCRSSGSVNAEFDAALITDGLTFGLELQGRVTGGNPAVSCPGGGGMGFPPPDPMLGRVASNQPLKAGDNVIGGEFSAPLQGAMGGMGSASSEGQMVLSITCQAP